MILKSAIRKFLEAPRDDFRSWKDYSEDKLERMQQELPVRPPIWNRLRKHQRVCLLIGAKKKRFAWWLDCVAGETKIETDQGPIRIDQLARQGRPIKVLSV